MKNKMQLSRIRQFFYCFIFASVLVQNSLAQNVSRLPMSLQECLSTAYQNSEQLKLVELESNYFKQLKRTAFELPKTSFLYTQGQFNSIYPYDNVLAVSQTFPFPSVLSAQAELGEAQRKGVELKKEFVKSDLTLHIKEVYYSLQHLVQESELLSKEDSIYEIFLKMEEQKRTEAVKNDLEQVTTITQAHFIQSTYNEILEQVNDNKIALQYLLRLDYVPEVANLPEQERILLPDTSHRTTTSQPHLMYLKEQIEIQKQTKKVEKQKGAPDIMLGYFNQSIYGPANIYGDDYFLTTSNRLQGFQVGLQFPLYYVPHRARVKASAIQLEMAEEHLQLAQKDMQGRFEQALNKYFMNKKNLEYYQENILKNAKQMVQQSLEAFHKKEINYIEYLAIVSKSFELGRNYLHLIYKNNLAVIQLEYFLSGEVR